MGDQADRLASAIRDVIRERMEHSPAARTLARELARWVLTEVERIEGRQPEGEGATPSGETPASAPQREPDSDAGDPDAAPASSASGATSRAEVPLRLGGAEARVEVPGSSEDLAAAREASSSAVADARDASRGQGPLREIDLTLIARRARLKAEACRLYIERRDCEGDPTREPEVLKRMNAMIADAKSMDGCFLWVFRRETPQPLDQQLRTIAGCYDTIAAAAELCEAATDPDGWFGQEEMARGFQHFAEASSALRSALQRWASWLGEDRDQEDSHFWLRREAFDRRVYIERHMTLEDPADPTRSEELRAEIRGMSERADERREQARRIESLFNTARYHARRLPGSDAADAHDCRRINEAVAELERAGVPRDDPRFAELRSTLRGAAFAPAHPRHAFLQVESPDSGAASAQEPGADEAAARATGWSERVDAARELLRGGRVVIVGGESRAEHIESIRKAFELREVEWVSLTEHGSSEPLRAPITRPETSLVLVLIRFCGHLHADKARAYARESDTPIVMLQAGYNPEQIAAQVMRQVSERLG